jgi:hypothetical protein
MGCLSKLVRIPAGLVLGFVVTAIVTFLGLGAVMTLAGTDFCYEGSSWVASRDFCITAFFVGLVASFTGGFVAMRIGGTGAIVILCLFTALLGTAGALGITKPADEARFADRPETRPEELGIVEAAGWSETPNWCEWVNVGIGVVGAALGASVARGPTHARAKSGSRSKSKSSAE